MNNLIITNISAATIQVVGNKSVGEGVSYATELTDISSSEAFMKQLIEKSFSCDNKKHFTYIDSLELNPVYTFVRKVFEDKETFLKQSNNIATYLYDQSIHPNIKSGEFYVISASCEYNGIARECIVLLKSERKDPFLIFENNGRVINVRTTYGVGIKNLDKGCIIINEQEDDGFVVLTIDKTNSGADAHYWTDSFLHVTDCNDSYHNTVQMADMCTAFVRELKKEENDLYCAQKAKQATALLSSASTVDTDCLKSIFCDSEEHSQKFEEFKTRYEQQNGKLPEKFMPEVNAFKRKSVTKMNTVKLGLDFEIKILNPNAEVETGFDEKRGKKYYKLYFNEEK